MRRDGIGILSRRKTESKKLIGRMELGKMEERTIRLSLEYPAGRSGRS